MEEEGAVGELEEEEEGAVDIGACLTPDRQSTEEELEVLRQPN
jgi:hypothetical protein